MRTSKDSAGSAALGRALLARQGLLARHDGPLVDTVEAVGALQAQQWSSPPVQLWSRVSGFTADALWAALSAGALVTGILMRRTLHLVSAREHPAYARVAADTGVDGWLTTPMSAPPAAADLLASTLAYAAATRTGDELEAFAESWVSAHPGRLPPEAVQAQRAYRWRPLRAQPAFVKAPAAGTWSARTPAAYRAAPSPPAAADAGWELAVRRHLGAFGPAGADDVAAWLGCPVGAVKPVLARLDLETLGEVGSRRVLYDLPGAPRPDEDVDAPPRFLPAFDGALVAYAAARRARILPDEYRARVYQRANLRWLPTFLVDGLVAGVWSTAVKRGTAVLTVTPFAPLPRAASAALLTEAEALVRFMEPGARTHAVELAP